LNAVRKKSVERIQWSAPYPCFDFVRRHARLCRCLQRSHRRVPEASPGDRCRAERSGRQKHAGAYRPHDAAPSPPPRHRSDMRGHRPAGALSGSSQTRLHRRFSTVWSSGN